jgi:hypothetical protein
MSGTRLDKWKEPLKTAVFTHPVDDEEVHAIFHRRIEARKEQEEEDPYKLTDYSLLVTAKELIFDIEDGRPTFHLILPTLNTQTVELEILPLLQMYDEVEDEEEVKDFVKRTLALASMLDVPVYPNTEKLAPELARYHRDLLIEGFKAPYEAGEYVRLVPANSPGSEVESLAHFQDMKLTEAHSPAEIHLMKQAVLAEIEKRDEAGRILASLRLAIAELDGLLSATERNEHALQDCLTHNPILFGTEYTRVIPKHKLGDEYEMDYALERVFGLVDLVEIEASTHRLFTRSGNPTQYLVHAEQQVLDWLDWIERYSPYARDRLPGLVQPLAYVVIGRSQDLSDTDRDRLRRRNIVFRGAFQILTYDDLLNNAENLLRVLEGRVSS